MIKAKHDLCEAQAREIARLNAEVKSLGAALQLAASDNAAEEKLRDLNNSLAAENYLLLSRLSAVDPKAMDFVIELMALKGTNGTARTLIATGYQHAARDLKFAVEQVGNPQVYDYVQMAVAEMERRAADLMATAHA